MTGEHEDREDELEFDDLNADDDAFIIEDWDELDQVLADVDNEVGKQSDEGSPLDFDDPDPQLFVIEDSADGSIGDSGVGPDAADSEFPSGGPASMFEPGPDMTGSPETMGIGGPESPDDVLFGTPSSRAPRGVKFGEPGDNEWGGAGMSADDIGIPTDEAGAAPSIDRYAGLEDAVDIDGDLEVDSDIGEEQLADPWQSEFGGDQGDIGEADSDKLEVSAYGFPDADAAPAAEALESQLSHDGYDEEAGEGEEAPEYDPIYGAQSEEGDEEGLAEEQAAEQELDYSEYDESYVEGDWAAADEAPRRRLPLRLIGSVAALLVVALGVGTVVFKPEWLGLRTAPVLVERTEVARPNIGSVLPPPAASLDDPAVVPVSDDPPPDPMTDPSTDPTVDPTTDPASDPTTDPLPDPTPDPAPTPSLDPTVEPTPDPIPIVEDPTAPTWIDPSSDTEGVVTIEGHESPDEAPEATEDLVAVGEELRVGQRVEMPGRGAEGSVRALGAGLGAGDQAFAQMLNGNFFLGQVKVFGTGDVTLRVKKGEVTLPFAELEKLGAINSEEYMNLMRTKPGLVKLTNDNRLAGSIIRTPDGRLALQVESQRIIIPDAEIEEISSSMPQGVRVGEDSDDEWVTRLIEKRLEKKKADELRRGKGSGAGTPPK